MTTKVLVTNFGPQAVTVQVMSKNMAEGVQQPDAVSREEIVSAQSVRDFLVYDSQYLVVKELPWEKR